MVKPKVCTVWLEGCAGCHMSFLDLDEALLDVLALVDLAVTPVTDFKDYDFPESTLGIVEGAVATDEQEEIVRKLREKCQVLMTWGDCAVFGGINAMRNRFKTDEILRLGFVETAGTVGGVVPRHPELPVLLPHALAVNEVVPVEVYVPGCPPSPEAILSAIKSVLEGKDPKLPSELIHFD